MISTYRVWSPTFEPDLPTRTYRAITRAAEGGFDGLVTCTHHDPQGRAVRTVVCATAGFTRSRSQARRQALRALGAILARFPREHVEEVLE